MRRTLLFQLATQINEGLQALGARDRIEVSFQKRNAFLLRVKSFGVAEYILKGESLLTMHAYLTGFLHSISYVPASQVEGYLVASTIMDTENSLTEDSYNVFRFEDAHSYENALEEYNLVLQHDTLVTASLCQIIKSTDL